MRVPLTFALVLAAVVSIAVPAAVASPKVAKVYGADGRRVAMIKRTNFGTKVYGKNGRRIATIRSR